MISAQNEISMADNLLQNSKNSQRAAQGHPPALKPSACTSFAISGGAD
jgi:hypothetical protein